MTRRFNLTTALILLSTLIGPSIPVAFSQPSCKDLFTQSKNDHNWPSDKYDSTHSNSFIALRAFNKLKYNHPIKTIYKKVAEYQRNTPLRTAISVVKDGKDQRNSLVRNSKLGLSIPKTFFNYAYFIGTKFLEEARLHVDDNKIAERLVITDIDINLTFKSQPLGQVAHYDNGFMTGVFVVDGEPFSIHSNKGGEHSFSTLPAGNGILINGKDRLKIEDPEMYEKAKISYGKFNLDRSQPNLTQEALRWLLMKHFEEMDAIRSLRPDGPWPNLHFAGKDLFAPHNKKINRISILVKIGLVD